MSVKDSPMRAAPKQGPDCNLHVLGDSVLGDSVGRPFTINELMKQSRVLLLICMGRLLIRVGASSIANQQINCPSATSFRVSAQHAMLEFVFASKLSPPGLQKIHPFRTFPLSTSPTSPPRCSALRRAGCGFRLPLLS